MCFPGTRTHGVRYNEVAQHTRTCRKTLSNSRTKKKTFLIKFPFSPPKNRARRKSAPGRNYARLTATQSYGENENIMTWGSRTKEKKMKKKRNVDKRNFLKPDGIISLFHSSACCRSFAFVDVQHLECHRSESSPSKLSFLFFFFFCWRWTTSRKEENEKFLVLPLQKLSGWLTILRNCRQQTN